jgi:hypothetical protein
MEYEDYLENKDVIQAQTAFIIGDLVYSIVSYAESQDHATIFPTYDEMEGTFQTCTSPEC